MKSTFSYYRGSAIFTVICLAIAWAFAGPAGALLALVLSILETSVSLDNAVVNAKVLQGMDEKWRARFLTWGMLFSVAFVRILFPILIVYATSPLSLWGAVVLPFQDATKYAEVVQAAHITIAGYGGAFLLMVFLSFFVDEEKEHHWIPGVENLLAKLSGGKSTTSAVILGTLILTGVWCLLPAGEQSAFGMSAFWGLVTWLAVHALGILLEGDGETTAAKAGVGAFIYLNVLDASFSFDGVIGAFAVSNNIVIISAGLAAGAMFVRSMTIHMVDKGTLGTLRYLEHGAFWSIGVLAGMMFVGINVHIPEILTGLSAAAILAVAVAHSLIHNKSNKDYVFKEVMPDGSLKNMG